ncbi:MAG TPA: MOP flippase family protein [Albitalea sp.]|nr:MOP flippase family protein [Albitalea sp.]HJW11688.1 MOP flippase family protein [Albitalea sp.]
MTSDPRDQAVGGVRWAAVGGAGTALLQALQVIVLARFLSPLEFGLFATVGVVAGFATFLAEAGLGPAVIRRGGDEAKVQATAHVLSLALSWASALVVFALAHPLAALYDAPQLVSLVQAASLIFVIQPVGLTYAYLLQRDLRFRALTIIDLSTGVLATAAAIVAAATGWGAMSLVIGQVTGAIVRSLLLFGVGTSRYGLQLAVERNELKYFIRFGSFQIGDNLVNYLNSQIDILLLGKLAGPEALGVYFAAKQLAYKPLQLINPVVTKVALPVFARLQGDPARLRSGYLAVVGSLALVQVPVYGLLAGLSGLVAALVLGPQWGAAAPVLALLSLYMLLRATINPVGSLLLASGQVERSLAWNLGVMLLIAPAIAIGAHWGALGAALAHVIAMALLHIPAWWALVRPSCGASAKEYFTPQLTRLAEGIVCFAPMLAVPDGAPRIAAAVLGLAVYAGLNRTRGMQLLRRA